MEEIDLIELLKMFWSKKIIMLIIIFAFVIAGIIYTTQFVEPVYTSTTSLLLATSNKNEIKDTIDESITATDITINSKLISTYRELVRSKNILGKVKANLNIDMDEEVLKAKISVNSVKDTEVIEISVTDKDNSFSERVANEIAKVFIEYINATYKRENIHIVDRAEIEETPSNINHKKDVLIFTVIGFIIAVMYVFIRNMFDTTIKTAEELENLYQLPVLASIPIYGDDLKKNNDKRRIGGKKNEK